MSKRTVLLTGATGYIASHTWLALLAAGYRVVGLDDFSNSSPEVLNRLQRLSGHAPSFERANVVRPGGAAGGVRPPPTRRGRCISPRSRRSASPSMIRSLTTRTTSAA